MKASEVAVWHSTSASAHGKVLVLGGYHIMNEGGEGIALAVSPKITTYAECLEANLPGPLLVMVVSRVHSGSVLLETSSEDAVVQLSGFGAFVACAITVCLSELRQRGISLSELHVHVGAAPEFYSDAGKTGLGSSSATVASLVAAVLHCWPQHFAAHDVQRAAVAAHRRAQGGSGSGYDVVTALRGSAVLRRTNNTFLRRPLTVHPCVRLALLVPRGASACGSSTRELVHAVREVAAPALREELSARVVAALPYLEAALTDGRAHKAPAWAELRVCLQNLGRSAGVEIEPHSVTPILDALMGEDFVIAAGVPGAGGYDAPFVLFSTAKLDEANAVARISTLCPNMDVISLGITDMHAFPSHR